MIYGQKKFISLENYVLKNENVVYKIANVRGQDKVKYSKV